MVSSRYIYLTGAPYIVISTPLTTHFAMSQQGTARSWRSRNNFGNHRDQPGPFQAHESRNIHSWQKMQNNSIYSI